MYCTVGSTTQTSGKPISVTKLNVRLITPVKMAEGQVTRNEANVRPMTIPRYLARSPSSIFSAIKFICVYFCAEPGNLADRRLLETNHFLRLRSPATVQSR